MYMRSRLENMTSLDTEITELKEGQIYMAKDGFYMVQVRFVAVGTQRVSKRRR